MTKEELKQEAEEYVKKDGTETEKLLNSVKLSLTREEATVLIKCIKQSYIDGATEETKELREDLDHKKIAIKSRNARIKELEKRIEKYKKDLKELRVAFIQAQAMALSGGKSLEDIIGQMKDITFGVSN